MRHLAAHDHDDNALTIGCPACIELARRDQANASWLTAPVRRCTWRFQVRGLTCAFDLDVHVPSGVEPWEVDEWWAGDTGVPIAEAIAAKFPDLSGDEQATMFYTACQTIRCTTIGRVVRDSLVAVDQPDLFGAAS